MSRIFHEEHVLLRTNAFAVKFTGANALVFKYNVKVVSPKVLGNEEELEEGEIPEISHEIAPSEHPFIISDFFIQKCSLGEFRSDGIPISPSLDAWGTTIFSPKKIDKWSASGKDVDQFILHEFELSDKRQAFIDVSPSSTVDLTSCNDAAVTGMESIIRHRPKKDMVTCGQYFYRHRSLDSSRVDLDPLSELATGFFLSGVKVTVNGPIIVIDHCDAVMSKEGNVASLLKNHVTALERDDRCTRGRSAHSLYDSSDCDQTLNQFLTSIIGLRCQVSYMGYTKKFKVKAISQLSTTNTKFYWSEVKGEISIEEYFRRRYSIRLRYPHLPCLISGKEDRPVYYPIELCFLPGDERIPPARLSPALISYLTSVKKDPHPNVRYDYCVKAAQHINHLAHDHLENYNIELDTNPLVTYGRLAVVPHIGYARNQVKPDNGRWRPQQFLTSQKLDKWFVVNTSNSVNSIREIDDFIQALIDYAKKFTGLLISKPRILDYSNVHPPEDIAARSVLDCLNRAAGNIQLLLFIIDEKRSLYPSIHYACDVLHGITATCLQIKNIRPDPKNSGPRGVRYHASVLQTLSHKINTRLGGVNSKLNLSPMTLSDIYDGKTMIVGCDVSHPDASLDNSVAACVASMDIVMMKYVPIVQVQVRSSEEIITAIDEMMRGQLHNYERHNRTLPSRIIIFRDGVSQNQFNAVKISEIDKMEKVFEIMYKQRELPLPQLVFIVVQKRHRMRFFQDNGTNAHLSNPAPGTVVDDVVIAERNVDFYLLSHSNKKGTSRPAHYHVLRNDTDLTTNMLQHLSFMLCHSYARCAASISIPAPVMYAHLAAYRMRILLIGYKQHCSKRTQESGDNASRTMSDQGVEIANPLKNTMYFC